MFALACSFLAVCDYNKRMPPSNASSPPVAEISTNPQVAGFGRARVGVALLIAILAVSTASIFIRFAQQDAPSLVIAALRLTCATLLLAPLALARHRSELISLTRGELLLGAVSGLF